MKYADQVEHVKRLIERAASAGASADTSLKQTQAALNAAHAIAVLEQIAEKRES